MTTETYQLQLVTGRRGRKQLSPGPTKPVAEHPPRRNRATRLMALSIRLDDLVRRGQVRDCAEIARLGHVTRARVSQVMALLDLAPDLQADLLELPPVTAGRDRITERDLRPITRLVDWSHQRAAWRALRARVEAQAARQ